MYWPDSGTITVEGCDLVPFSQESRRRLFSAVFQDFCTHGLTTRENIAFGDIGRLGSDDAILAAARQGMADDVLKDLPNGLDIFLGRVDQEGMDLFVGQWQRMVIGRVCMSIIPPFVARVVKGTRFYDMVTARRPKRECRTTSGRC